MDYFSFEEEKIMNFFKSVREIFNNRRNENREQKVDELDEKAAVDVRGFITFERFLPHEAFSRVLPDVYSELLERYERDYFERCSELIKQFDLRTLIFNYEKLRAEGDNAPQYVIGICAVLKERIDFLKEQITESPPSTPITPDTPVFRNGFPF